MVNRSGDFEADVVVVGSGGAGLSAALAARHQGADVLVLERSDRYGGTTAVSGGVLWIPNNDRLADVGSSDSPEQALTYLRRLSLGKMQEELIQAYVSEARHVIRFIEHNSKLRFKAISYPDYHAEFEGGTFGRSVCVGAFPAGELGAYRQYLRASPIYTLPVSAADWEEGTLNDPDTMGKRIANDMVGMGAALVAGLLEAAMTKGVRFERGVRARKLKKEGARIAGVAAERDGSTLQIRARRAVILASGGFEWNEDLKRQFLRGPLELALSPPHNTGDGLLMAMDVGASLGNMAEAWWQPAICVPGEMYDGKPLAREAGLGRSGPGSIMVNRQGRRFMNEAANYNDQGRVFHTFDPQAFDYPNLPAWIILHRGFLDKYPFANYAPGNPVPSWLVEAPTVAELAGKIGVDPAALEETVSRFNRNARELVDPDFHRGEAPLEQYSGSRFVESSKAFTLGPLDQPPFYACPVHCAAIGTKGGPRTNAQAQVLDTDGHPIPGLYAAGNCSASAMGMGYPGGGATIGPAVVFGHIAGRGCAAR